MNTTGKSKRSSSPRSQQINQRLKPRVEAVLQEQDVTLQDLLFWQSNQLHAALRKRLMTKDPLAVSMVDALVRHFFTQDFLKNQSLEVKYDDAIEELSEGRKILGGQWLPENEIETIMRQPVAWDVARA
jgi:hypothetical protein